MWASRTEADSYLSHKFGGESWDSLSDLQKDQLLTTAYRRLVNDPMYSYPDTPTQRMIDAQIELAFALINADNSASIMAAAGIESFRIGNYSQTMMSDADVIGERQTYPQEVLDLLAPYRRYTQARYYVTRKAR